MGGSSALQTAASRGCTCHAVSPPTPCTFRPRARHSRSAPACHYGIGAQGKCYSGGGGRGGWGDAGRPVRQTARAAHPVRVGRAECWAPRAGSPQNVWLCEIEGISQLQDGICGVGATAWMGQNQARKAGAAQQGETARHAAKLAAGGVRRANPLRRALRGLVSHFPGKQSRQHDPSTGNPNPA